MFKQLRTVSAFLLLLGTLPGVAQASAFTNEANVQITQQSEKCTGTITDEHGEPMIGASVFVKGTKQITSTDMNGQFTLSDVKRGAQIHVSCVGYKAVDVVWEGTALKVVLQEDDKNKLNEVVVTALGIKRQARSLGYSTTKVDGEDFAMVRDPNLGNALSGKVAGVSVSGNATGGGSSRVIIRGNASLTGNNMPLYVVDGVPFDNSNQGSAGTYGGMDMGDGLNNINPDDIESIQVLKGAADRPFMVIEAVMVPF